jgi:hypothetical protein
MISFEKNRQHTTKDKSKFKANPCGNLSRNHSVYSSSLAIDSSKTDQFGRRIHLILISPCRLSEDYIKEQITKYCTLHTT